MKILVISDTHGRIDAAKELIDKINPDFTFHLGDMADDCKRLEERFMHKVIACVKGNNDYFDKTYPLERIAKIGGKTFFACHGHKYNVKTSLNALRYRAQELGADIVLFGHTHIPFVDSAEDMIMLNPGTTGTYGIIEINEGKVNASVQRYK